MKQSLVLPFSSLFLEFVVKGGKYRGILTLNPQSFEGRLEISWAFRRFLPSGSEVWAEVMYGVQKEVGAELGEGRGRTGKGQSHFRSRGRRNTPQDEYILYVFPCPLTIGSLPSMICRRLTVDKEKDDQVQKKREGTIGVAKKFVRVFS